MNKFTITPEKNKKLQEYQNSIFYKTESKNSKSTYWNEHADLVSVKYDNQNISISGDSGFYIPPSNNFIENITKKFKRVFADPTIIFRKIKEKYFKFPKMYSYEKVFDLVINHASVSDPDLSPFRINHLKWKDNSDLFLSSKDVKRVYQSWSGRRMDEPIYLHYYYINIIKNYVKGIKVKRILEIGAGNGNFPSILFHHLPNVSIYLVDLPEMIPVCFSYLSTIYPNAKINLPHEANYKNQEFDIQFLTPSQLNLVKTDSIDLAINCHSFQEMPQPQIKEYFSFLKRILRKGGYFFTANRIEKIPVGKNAYTTEQLDLPNRFHLYPWNPKSKIIIDEVSRFSRLVQLDGIGIRLEITNP